MTYRYTPHSGAARLVGERILALTDAYSDLEMPRNTPIPLLIELALVSRARRLLEVAYRIADTGDDFSAAILLRAMNETGMTFAWLIVDPELAARVMRLDEIRWRMNVHETWTRIGRNTRRAATRRGEAVPALPPGGSLGVLSRMQVTSLKKLDKDLRAEVTKLPRFTRRKKRLGITQIARIPPFAVRAKKSKNDLMYAAYQFDSNSAAHPNLLGLQQFVGLPPGEMLIMRDAPEGARPDPYATGAIYMGLITQLASHRDNHPPISAAHLDVMEADLKSLA